MFCSTYSNAIGRSGTFCVLYTVLEKVKAEKVADVFQTVKLLRIQRPGIVEDLVRVAVIFRKLNYTVVFCCRTNIVLFLVQHCNFFNHLKITPILLNCLYVTQDRLSCFIS